MCFKVDCSQCGKYSWGGCGKHLSAVYANIEKGKHCMCRSWPGVVMPVEPITTDQPPLEASSASTTITGTQKS
ncbi:hypothetical protein K2173_021257 [Erythroxylum novogranatense]|uniref:Uncharacterized protein n=1 Tax=Erythroxylum novogranatense TaxID=1862640 RepID=A0AAV8TXN9_9ROSI|nr:hypothetical protein K2173_021257 [Erythroxylum novogranatense]